ncbi:hypothetical protein [Saccharothrix sp. HUAS TT1]|uniref:hypothetical protein n=1 Tax=unclassified Saccharothrix TaxID=2593673 RepID=UPI00345B8B5A
MVLPAALVVVLAAASAPLIALYAGARGEHVPEVQRLEQSSRSLTDAENRLAATDAQNDDVANRITGLEARNADLRRCAEPAKDTIIAARDGDDAALGPAIGRATANC